MWIKIWVYRKQNNSYCVHIYVGMYVTVCHATPCYDHVLHAVCRTSNIATCSSLALPSSSSSTSTSSPFCRASLHPCHIKGTKKFSITDCFSRPQAPGYTYVCVCMHVVYPYPSRCLLFVHRVMFRQCPLEGLFPKYDDSYKKRSSNTKCVRNDNWSGGGWGGRRRIWCYRMKCK